ncbi:phosphotransferase [Nonomuraea sp. NPDC050451]|uniref:phosphotransferase n=1 Tax=Nonomuraea sp. NPDC050451 TaxID=3364364 RepID=UPI003796FD16
MTHTEIEISAELVRDLLRDQHPDLADRPVRLGARGWANQLWRLGDDLAVRLPWVGESADALLLKEYTWLPSLAPRLPLPVPVPQHLGEPSARFPRPWIVTTWVPGEPADRAPVQGQVVKAFGPLARALRDLAGRCRCLARSCG